jgi:two-component system LytT family response regulator/two-component system response regulator LytT
MPKTDIPIDRILIRARDGVRIAIDPASIYYLDAERGDTLVRRRGAAELVDVRRLEEIEPLLRPQGFLRIHRSFIVNLRRIREIRSRGRDLEVRLEVPVNKVLPVSRDAAAALLAAFGEA